jgi:hypothetical protein
MALFLVSFSGRLTKYADAARAELEKWGATHLWNDVWIVEMDPAPEDCLPGFVQTEAALSIRLEGSDAFFSVGRAAGMAAQIAYTERVAPVVRALGSRREAPAKVHYCNDGEALFGGVVARYLDVCENSIWATDLCRLMASFGSDKGIGWHTYTPFYQSLFLERRGAITNFFELGLGTNNEDTPSNMGSHGRPGASLRAWREYFPNALIYGADVDKRVLFSEERIETFLVDQRVPASFEPLWEHLADIELDVFLDDGLHTYEAARTTLTQSIGKVRSGGYYIIEDVMKEDLPVYLQLIEQRGLPGLSIDIDHPANVYDNCLVVAAAR